LAAATALRAFVFCRATLADLADLADLAVADTVDTVVVVECPADSLVAALADGA
jgi:hypothetical protein